MNTELNHTHSTSLAKRVLRGLLLVSAVLIILFIISSLGLFMVETLSGDQLKNLNQSIRTLGFWTQFIRWALYLMLFFYWPSIISFWGRTQQWDDVIIERAKMSRNSSLFILLAVELFLIQSIHVPLYAFLMKQI
ncbi:MAG: hypothetical protein H8E09_00110 [Gammaproteobacteria bacterium]|nr:hypothetical protein [Gammaproteobacteria bacterium]